MTINEVKWNPESEGASILSENPALADFTDVNGLAKAYVDAKTLMGNSVRLPSKEASETDRTSFVAELREKVPELILAPDYTSDESMMAHFLTLGRPEAVDGYELPEVEGASLPDERVEKLKELALGANLTKKQFKTLVEDEMRADLESTTRGLELQDAGMTGLKAEWGLAFNDKMARAIKIAEATGAPKDVVESVRDQTVPIATVKWLDSLGKALGSEDFQVALQTGGGGGMTPDEAKERASEIRTKIHEMKPTHPDYNVLIKRMMDFDAVAAGKAA